MQEERQPDGVVEPAEMAEILISAGGATKLGLGIGITQQAVSQWMKVPANRVLAVERLTGIPRTRLRPDLYPPEVATHQGVIS